jgi:hypothetical protein
MVKNEASGLADWPSGSRRVIEEIEMGSIRRQVGLGLVAGTIALLSAGQTNAGIHTWDVNEVFSNADGTIQFVELYEADGLANETGVGFGTISSNTESHNWNQGAVAAPTTNKRYLIATPAFANLPGAPTPDVILPAGKVPFFSPGGDTVAFLTYDSWTFGAIPTNGTDSLDALTGVGPNSPTNYAGATGSVDASPPPPNALPAASAPTTLLLLALLSAAGVTILWGRRRRTA